MLYQFNFIHERVNHLSDVVIISGNPNEISETEQVLKYLGLLLIEEGFSVKHISVKDIPPETLFNTDSQNPLIQQMKQSIHSSHGIIIGSPVLQGSFSGVLKAYIDLLPPNIFEQKPVLPIMTGESLDYHFILEYSFKPLLANLKGLCMKGVYILNNHIDKFKENPIIDRETSQIIKKQLSHFTSILPSRSSNVIYMNDVKLKGHETFLSKSRKPIN